MATKNSFTIFTVALLLFSLAGPLVASANGGDQRVVEGRYLINLSRSPFTPRAGENTAMLISFVNLETNTLISEDLIATIRIAKLSGIISTKEFLFEKDGILVQGGALEFSYVFEDAGLHEIFIDFTLVSNPQKTYVSPDFLLDVQGKEPTLERSRFMLGFIGSGIAGVIVGLTCGLWLRRRRA